jgi:hypothetical protein
MTQDGALAYERALLTLSIARGYNPASAEE